MFENLKKSKKFDLLMELKKNGVSDKSVLNVIEIIDRSLFVDENLKQKSNLNIALPIDCGQTISQPLVVAHMTQSLNLNNNAPIPPTATSPKIVFITPKKGKKGSANAPKRIAFPIKPNTPVPLVTDSFKDLTIPKVEDIESLIVNMLFFKSLPTFLEPKNPI